MNNSFFGKLFNGGIIFAKKNVELKNDLYPKTIDTLTSLDTIRLKLSM